MKVAIIGSRGVRIDLSPYIPPSCDTVISGGAAGIDTCAAEFARKSGLKLIEIVPDYKLYGKMAPLIRNDQIIEMADFVIAFWDGKSKGTSYVIKQCIKANKKINVIHTERGMTY